MSETWMPAPGMEGRYEVSSFGQVRTVERRVSFGSSTRVIPAHIRRPQPHPRGYLQLTLTDSTGRKVNCYIHRLVALAFVPNPLAHGDIDHIDENKRNNTASNLEWVSRRQNLHRYLHGTKRASLPKVRTRKLTLQDVQRIRMLQPYASASAVATEFRISKAHVYDVWNRKVWNELAEEALRD